MFDEISLKKHFDYNPKEDVIDGYQDHGAQGRSPNVASYALVFMVAGIRKTVKQPIAHFFSSGFSTADRLAVLLKEILQQCFASGINIYATVCDMDGVNRRALFSQDHLELFFGLIRQHGGRNNNPTEQFRGI
ncbi:uncharacterized protein LOC125058853 [Pieris napi]|uniref:uncharacterized protein LOC125058853 n=1 Tax=Pieris napi TaxID=78633 RepID=UPI001FB90A1C|nr:uncharacterized protein LOC125058853 [Pieris napi]